MGGIFQFIADSENRMVMAPTTGGKYFLAFVIGSCVLLLGKCELLTQAFGWRFGKRGTMLAALLLFLILAVIVLSSVSLVYGSVSPIWLTGGQLLCAAFFIHLLLAGRNVPEVSTEYDITKIRLTHYLSSGALIYSGIYLIGFGLLVKGMMRLGGDWQQFISFCAALGAIVLALALITGESLRHRWTRFVERNLLAGAYDFRSELQKLAEAISMAADRDKLIQTVCQTLADIFRATHCHLFVEEDSDNAFRLFTPKQNGEFTIASEVFTLSCQQVAWFERMHKIFAVDNLPDQETAPMAENKKSFITANRYILGATLFAGQRLLGGILLGPKRMDEPYSEEDKQLLDVLANAISIALHGAYLQQHFLAAKQMESLYRVASFMMHDLRNAVSTLTLLAQNAATHLEKKAFRADFVSAVSRVAHEMQRLIHKLAAVKAGGEIQRFEECFPDELILDALADLSLPANVELKEDIPQLPKAHWDRGQIRIVLRNLLLNGLEAMPEGGTLAIQGRHEQAQIHIAVSDTGAGMSPEFIRQRLFKPNQTTKPKGLGIGLYQSKEIIAAHQGKILVKSQLKSGTTFEIVLPRRPDQIDQPEEISVPSPERTLHAQWHNLPIT
jgi:putative PEP-CTERM system histidine kinase